jgi:hypothetical protein
MRLVELSTDRLLIESIHPGLHDAIASISKKFADQLSDVVKFAPAVGVEQYIKVHGEVGWIVGWLQRGGDKLPIAMYADGSITMPVGVFDERHSRWINADKFINYVRRGIKKESKQSEIHRVIELLDRLISNTSIERSLQSGVPAVTIWSETWNKIANRVGLPHLIANRNDDLVISPDGVTLSSNISLDRHSISIGWPEEIVDALKSWINRKLAKYAVPANLAKQFDTESE